MKRNRLLFCLLGFILTSFLLLSLLLNPNLKFLVSAQENNSDSNQSNTTVGGDDSNNSGSLDANASSAPAANAAANAQDTLQTGQNQAVNPTTSSYPTASDQTEAEKRLEAARTALQKANQLLSDIDSGIITNIPRSTALAAVAQAQAEFAAASTAADSINLALDQMVQASEAEIAAQRAAQQQLTAAINSAGNNVAAVLAGANNLWGVNYGAAVAQSNLPQTLGVNGAIDAALAARASRPVDEKAGIAATITILTGGTLKQAAENAYKIGGLMAYAATLISDPALASSLNQGNFLESLAKEVVTFAVDQAKARNAQIDIAQVSDVLAAMNISQDMAAQIISTIAKVDLATVTKVITSSMHASIVRGATLTGASSGLPSSPLYLSLIATPRPTTAPIENPPATQAVPFPPQNGDWPQGYYFVPAPGGGVGGTAMTTSGKTQNGTFTEGQISYQITKSNGGSNTTIVSLVGSPITVINGLLQNESAAQFSAWIQQNGFTLRTDGTYGR